MGCRVSVEASDPLTTPAPETQGAGGEGEGRVRGCCLSSSKVNGCHGPANGDGEPTVNLTLPVRVLCGVGGSGVVGCTAFGWVLAHRQKPSVAPLSLSSFLSFSLLLSRSRSLAAICM